MLLISFEFTRDLKTSEQNKNRKMNEIFKQTPWIARKKIPDLNAITLEIIELRVCTKCESHKILW